MPFLSILTFTSKLVRARDQTRLRVNLTEIRSSVPEIFRTQEKPQTDGGQGQRSKFKGQGHQGPYGPFGGLRLCLAKHL